MLLGGPGLRQARPGEAGSRLRQPEREESQEVVLPEQPDQDAQEDPEVREENL